MRAGQFWRSCEERDYCFTMLSRLFLCAALLLTFGCTVLEAAPVTYVVITSEAPVIAQAATQPARQQVSPDEQLRQAHVLAHNGYYEEAIAAYRELLDLEAKPALAAIRADAAFALGRQAKAGGRAFAGRAPLFRYSSEISPMRRVGHRRITCAGRRPWNWSNGNRRSPIFRNTSPVAPACSPVMYGSGLQTRGWRWANTKRRFRIIRWPCSTAGR